MPNCCRLSVEDFPVPKNTKIDDDNNNIATTKIPTKFNENVCYANIAYNGVFIFLLLYQKKTICMYNTIRFPTIR